MARQTVVQFIDDIDGNELTEAVTVRFGLDGSEYEFDTSPAHAEQFRASLTRYLDASRPARLAHASKSSEPKRRPTEQNQAIRRWAQANGYEIGARGPHS